MGFERVVPVHAVYDSRTPGVSTLFTWHATTYSYDNHVPVVFLGVGIRAGEHDGPIAANDIAATLAPILHVETPSGPVGRALTEMLTL